MANVLIQSSTLTGIANAIRAKDGSTAPMYPSEMAEKISNIPEGIPIPNPITAGDVAVKKSEVSSATTTTKTSMQATGIYITITKAGTYRFKHHISKRNYHTGTYSKLYKNGIGISGTECGKGSYSTNFDSSHDISCNSGDRIEVYANGGVNSDDLAATTTVTTLSACINLDFSYFD